jgi:hypothetical protein
MATRTNTAQQSSNSTSDIERSLKLQEMSLTDLLAEAKRLGVKVTSTDKSDVIAALIQGPSLDVVRNGFLIALNTQTPERTALVKRINQAITQNIDARARRVECTLYNSVSKDYYVASYPGVPVLHDSPNLAAIQDATSFSGENEANDELNKVVQEFRDDPSMFETMALVRVTRNLDGRPQNFAMLYVRKAGKRPDATTF